MACSLPDRGVLVSGPTDSTAQGRSRRAWPSGEPERFHIGWKQKPLYHSCIVAFSDGKPDSTPEKALVGILLLDPFTDRVAHKARHPDRGADLAFGLLDRLRHAPVGEVNERLIEQTDFLVEGLET